MAGVGEHLAQLEESRDPERCTENDGVHGFVIPKSGHGLGEEKKNQSNTPGVKQYCRENKARNTNFPVYEQFVWAYKTPKQETNVGDTAASRFTCPNCSEELTEVPTSRARRETTQPHHLCSIQKRLMRQK